MPRQNKHIPDLYADLPSMSQGYGPLSSQSHTPTDEEEYSIIESPFPPVTTKPSYPNFNRPFNRRRTTQTFAPVSGFDSLRSNPTVGRSSLTASFSTTNIPRPAPIKKPASRIPTPTNVRRGRVSMGNSAPLQTRIGRASLSTSQISLEVPKQVRPKASLSPSRSFSSRIPTPSHHNFRRLAQESNGIQKENMPLTTPRPRQFSKALPNISTATPTAPTIPRPLPEPELNMGYLDSDTIDQDLSFSPLSPLPPLSLSPPALNITKSKTMSMLSSFTSSLSISSISARLTTSRSSLTSITNRHRDKGYSNNLHSSPYTDHLASSPLFSSPLVSSPLQQSPAQSPSSKPLPPFTTNIRQVSMAQDTSYWLGRVVALQDRFQTEKVQDCQYLTIEERSLLAGSPPPTPASTTSQRTRKGLSATKQHSDKEDERRAKRIFVHLEALCLTDEAKRSLRTFRIEYARSQGKPWLLPRGASMEGDGLLGRVGRVFSSSTFGSSSGLGTKGGTRRRRESLLCHGNEG